MLLYDEWDVAQEHVDFNHTSFEKKTPQSGTVLIFHLKRFFILAFFFHGIKMIYSFKK